MLTKDVVIHATGSNFYLVEPKSQEAKDWIDENVDVEYWHGDQFVCNQRHIMDLVDEMTDYGFVVR